MTARGAITLRLSHEYFAEIPEEIQLKCHTVTALDLSGSPHNGPHSFLSLFKNVTKLVFNRCALRGIPDALSELSQLEDLDLSSNIFVEGLNTTIGLLHRLKKLQLGSCELKAIPDCLGDLEALEELDLSRNTFSDGLNPTIGRLCRLKKLDLQACELQCLPDSFWELGALEELDLSINKFSRGLNPQIGRLRQLKKLLLRACELTAVPDTLGDLEALEELYLLQNAFRGDLYPTIGRLRTLKKLFLGACKLATVGDSIEDMHALQELHLSSNPFSDGIINPAIGRLNRLSYLFLQDCNLRAVPDELGDLELLQELHLSSNKFSKGINPAIGRLHRLQKLYLQDCELTTVPVQLGDLEQLQELDLSSNKFSDGLNPTIGRLCQLKKLFLQDCALCSFPDWLGELQTVEQLDLSSNKFSSGLNPSIGRLHRLKKLDLQSCDLKAVPDSLADLNAVSSLTLSDNNLEDYPACLLRMMNLKELDLSNLMSRRKDDKHKGNCIKYLPVELAFTKLRELTLEGNPITDPPHAIWTQGLDAIKSYMRAVIPGGELMLADTLNMIGDTGAGKTSVAESLVARSPRRTLDCDRTRVMQQLRMRIYETSGQSVTVNDFGGHEIYHSVMPVFLPANGLLILVLDLTNQMHLHSAKKWLLTAIAKTREIRIIIAGTHADKLNMEQRMTLEEHVVTLSSNVLRAAIDEVSCHISYIEARPNDVSMKLKMEALYQLLSNLRSATIRVVTLSCSVPDEGLPKLHSLVAELLLPPQTLPIRWCRVISVILKLRSHGFYIPMSQVQDIAKAHFAEEDDDEALTTILRYLAKASLIIWAEEHPRLRYFVFHAPQKIIDMCKGILHHDFQSFPLHFRTYWEEYERGIVKEPLLLELLKVHTVSLDGCREQIAATPLPFDVVADFLQQFNLIGNVATKPEGRTFIIPSKLTSEEPLEFKTLMQIAQNCLNRVSVHLSFIESLVPVAFFETCLSAMLTIAGQLSLPAVRPWRSGLIAVHGEVQFLSKLCDGSITLTAFSEPPVASPWTLLQPMLRRLNENATTWSGAPPSCAVECPWCVRGCQDEYRKIDVGQIKADLHTLAQPQQPNCTRPTCPKCFKMIPQSLCFPSASRGSFTRDQEEFRKFFENIDYQEHEDSACSSNLARKLAIARRRLVQELDVTSIECIIDELIAARDGRGLITDEERQLISAERTIQGKARLLLDTVNRRGAAAVRILAKTLSSSYCARPDLAGLFE